jgi:hypothetical protein
VCLQEIESAGDGDTVFMVTDGQAEPDGPTWKWVVEHSVAVLSAAGVVLTLLVALGYEFFYTQLEVRPAELGLGAREILSHGALGLLLLLGYNGLLLGSVTFLAWTVAYLVSDMRRVRKARRQTRAAPGDVSATEGAQHSTGTDAKESTEGLPAWRNVLVLVLTLVVMVLILVSLAVVLALRMPWLLTLLGALGVLAALWGPLFSRWVRRGAVDNESLRAMAPLTRGVPLLTASLWILVGGGAVLVSALSGPDPDVLGTLGGLILLAFGVLIGVAGFHELRRLWSASNAPRVSGWFILGALILMVAVQLAMVAFEAGSVARRLVERGEYAPTNLSPLVSAPVTCVRPQWLGPGEAPSWLPRSAFHLGGAGGTVVLYQSDVGAIRLPASAVALVPLPEPDCE